jgi:hypothetical protein
MGEIITFVCSNIETDTLYDSGSVVLKTFLILNRNVKFTQDQFDSIINHMFDNYDVSFDNLKNEIFGTITNHVHHKKDNLIISILKSKHNIHNVKRCTDVRKISENVNFLNNVNFETYLKCSNVNHLISICDELFKQSILNGLNENGIKNMVSICKKISPITIEENDGCWKIVKYQHVEYNFNELWVFLEKQTLIHNGHSDNNYIKDVYGLILYLHCKNNNTIFDDSWYCGIVETLSNLDNLYKFNDIQNEKILNLISSSIYEKFELDVILKLMNVSIVSWNNGLLFNKLCENLVFCETTDIITNIRKLYKIKNFDDKTLRELINKNAITLEEFVGNAFDIYTNKFKNFGAELKIDMSMGNFGNVLKLYKNPLVDEMSANDQNCKICYESKISSVYTACGHTVCTTCADSVSKHNGYGYSGNGNCPFCRKCSKTIKIYL